MKNFTHLFYVYVGLLTCALKHYGYNEPYWLTILKNHFLFGYLWVSRVVEDAHHLYFVLKKLENLYIFIIIKK